MVNITNAVFFYSFSVYNRRNRIHTFMTFFSALLCHFLKWCSGSSLFVFSKKVKLTRVEGIQSK